MPASMKDSVVSSLRDHQSEGIQSCPREPQSEGGHNQSLGNPRLRGHSPVVRDSQKKDTLPALIECGLRLPLMEQRRQGWTGRRCIGGSAEVKADEESDGQRL